MGEWKRIFLDKSRIILLLALTVICLLIFLTSLSDGISFSSIRHMLEAAKYSRVLCEKLSEMPLKEVKETISAEQNRIADFGNYINGFNMQVFESDDAAYGTMSDIPYLVSLSKNINEFNNAYGAYMRRLNELSEEADYLLEYPAYLSGVSEQVKTQSQVAVFGKSGGFAARNLKKTAEDFENLNGVTPIFGNNFGIEKWLEFGISDYFFLGILTVIVLVFLDERKAGLWSVVRVCKNGRLRLGLHRLGILFAASVEATVIMYLIPLTVSMTINGGMFDLNRPIQSLTSFKTCTLRITVFQWLIRFFTLKIFSGFAVGLLLWCVLGALSNPQFSVSVLGFFLIAEYLLYELLPVQSFLNILKYFNIFSYIHTADLYTNYLNINLFGIPADIRKLIFSVSPVLIFGLILWVLLIQSKRYPEGNKDYLSKLSDFKNRLLDVFRVHLSAGGWEIYKSLVYEFGAVILVAVFVLTGSLNYSSGGYEPDSYYRMYLSDLEGKIDENTDLYFERAAENIPQNSDSAVIINALTRLKNDVELAKAAAKKGNFEPWLVNQKNYDSFYGPSSLNRQRTNATVVIALLVLCCAGVFAYENQSGVGSLLRSQKRGRGTVISRKIAVCGAMSVLIWAAVYVREFINFIDNFGTKTLPSAVQNLPALADFPLKITLGQYLTILYALRLVMLAAGSVTILTLSRLSRTMLKSYILNFCAICVSALLTLFGAETLKYISPLVPISSAEVLWNMGGGEIIGCMWWIVWTLLAMTAGILAVKKWMKS